MTTMATLLVALIGATVLGAALAYLGWRGRRVGDHPFCRRCGFDLFGKSDDSHHCAECGADLQRPRATVVGVRTPRRGVLGGGVAMLVPAVLVLAVIGYGRAKGVDWQKQKPVWWLAREAESADLKTRDAALAELLNRYSAGTLSKPQVGDLVTRGLRVQGDVNKPWAVAWGDLIEGARLAGDVSDEQWKTYAGQAVLGSITLRFRPRLRKEDPVPYRLEYGPARVGRRAPLWRFSEISGMTVDGVEVAPKLHGLWTGVLSVRARGSSAGSLTPQSSFLRDLPIGLRRGVLKLRMDVADTAQLPPVLRPGARPPTAMPRPATGPQSAADRLQQSRQWRQQQEIWSQQRQDAIRAFRERTAPVLTTVDLELPFEFELVAPGGRSVEPIIDPALRERVARAVTVPKVVFMGGTVNAEVRFDKPPVDLSFEVFVRANGREWSAGAVTFRGGDPAVRRTTRYPSLTRPGADFARPGFGDATTGDILLRPSSEAAATTVDIVRYWGEEVVIRDVPIVDPFSELGQRQREWEARLLEWHGERGGGPVPTAPLVR